MREKFRSILTLTVLSLFLVSCSSTSYSERVKNRQVKKQNKDYKGVASNHPY